MPDESNRPGTMGSEGDNVSKEEETGSFRRFSDKVLYSAVGIVMVLTGTVWALTWFATDSKTQANSQRINVSDSVQQKHAERLIRLEVTQEQNATRLQSIDAKQSQIEGRVEGVQTSLNQVLLELRKR